jgi:hypothetical protein
VVKIRDKIDIGSHRRFTPGNRPEKPQMDDPGSFQFQLVLAQRLDYMPFVHTLNSATFCNPFQSNNLAPPRTGLPHPRPNVSHSPPSIR